MIGFNNNRLPNGDLTEKLRLQRLTYFRFQLPTKVLTVFEIQTAVHVTEAVGGTDDSVGDLFQNIAIDDFYIRQPIKLAFPGVKQIQTVRH